MKLISYRASDGMRLGALTESGYFDLETNGLPSTMLEMIALGDAGLEVAERFVAQSRPIDISETQILAPIPTPHRSLFAVGRNYWEHIEEGARARGALAAVTESAVFFSKLATTVIGPGDEIELDDGATSQLDYEVELAIVIGRSGKNIRREEALSYIYGYTIGNDISARDAQTKHLQWFKGKNMDTFCPLGPCIVPARYFGNAQKKRLTLKVNGDKRQDSTTELMIFDIPTIIEQLSRGLTLMAGDIILTGTPSGVGMGMTPQVWLRPGDTIEAEIEDIGILQNVVVKAP